MMYQYPIPGAGPSLDSPGFNNQAQRLSAASLSPASMGNASSDLSSTLRSFRDSLAFSFQTLNLTLSSLNNSVRTVGTKLGVSDIHGMYNQSQYVRSGPPGIYLGAMNPAYAQFTGNQSLVGMLTANPAYNVSPMEFWGNRASEMGYRMSSAGVNALGTAAEVGAGYAGTVLGGGLMARAVGLGGSTLARMAFGTPVGMIAGTLVGAVADPMIRVAQEHNRDVAALQRMSGRFTTGGLSLGASQRAMTGIENLAYNEVWNTTSMQPRLNMSGFRELTNMGLQGGLFHGSNPDDLVKQVSSAANVVKFLTGVLGNKDVQETMQLVKQMKDMGINLFQANGYAQGLGADLFKYSKAMGVNPGELMNIAANMSTTAFGQYGNPAYVGMQPAVRNLAYMQELEKRGALTPAEIAAGGGVQTMATRMLSAQAGMLNNATVGLPMLWAGYNGNGGFNIGQFQAAQQRGGYFGIVGQAANNLFSDGIWSIANVMTNQNNIMDSLAKQDYMNDALLGTLHAGLQNLPSFNERGRSRRDRTNLATMYIQNWMQSQGIDLDMGTAKAMATRIVSPEYAEYMESRANDAYRTGMMEQARAERSPGRWLESMGEAAERRGNALWHNFIQRPAREVADTLTRTFDFSYANDMRWQGQQQVTGTDFRNYRAAMQYLNQSGYLDASQYSTTDMLKAIRTVNNLDPSGILHTVGRVQDTLGGMITGTNVNALEDAVAANQRMQYADVWNRIGSSDRISRSSALARSASLFKDGVTVGDVAEYFDGQRNYSASEPVRLAANALWGEAGEDLIKDYANTRNTISTGLSSSGLGDLANRVIGTNSNITGFNNGVFEGATPDEVLEILNNQRFSGNIQAIADAYNKRNKTNNLSTEQIRAYVATQLAGKNVTAGGEGNRVAAAQLMGAGDQLRDLAVAFSSQENMTQFMGQEGMTGIDYTTTDAANLMQKVGITTSMLNDIMTVGGHEEAQALSDLIKAYNKTTDPDAKLLASLDKQIKSKSGRALMRRWEEEGMGNGYISTGMGRNLRGNEFLGAYHVLSRDISQNNVAEGLRSIGIDIDAAELQNLMATPGEYSRFIENLSPVNATQRNLQDYLKRIQGLSNEELNKRFGKQLGFEVTDTTSRSSAIDILMNAEASGIDNTIAATDKQVAMKKKTAIDSAVAMDGGDPYVRVKIAKNEAKEARADMSNTTAKGVKELSKPSKVPGQTTFTPGTEPDEAAGSSFFSWFS